MTANRVDITTTTTTTTTLSSFHVNKMNEKKRIVLFCFFIHRMCVGFFSSCFCCHILLVFYFSSKERDQLSNVHCCQPMWIWAHTYIRTFIYSKWKINETNTQRFDNTRRALVMTTLFTHRAKYMVQTQIYTQHQPYHSMNATRMCFCTKHRSQRPKVPFYSLILAKFARSFVACSLFRPRERDRIK